MWIIFCMCKVSMDWCHTLLANNASETWIFRLLNDWQVTIVINVGYVSTVLLGVIDHLVERAAKTTSRQHKKGYIMEVQ